MLEIVHQGVCLPIYLNLAASVDGWRFVTSVPEHQNARQQFLNRMAPALSQISRIPPCTADSLVPSSFPLSKSIRKTYSKYNLAFGTRGRRNSYLLRFHPGRAWFNVHGHEVSAATQPPRVVQIHGPWSRDPARTKQETRPITCISQRVPSEM